LSAPLIARLAEHPETAFTDRAAWQAHLDRLGLTGLTITPEPVQIATEEAIRGSIHAHDYLRDAVVLSDDAGQFAVGRHALCRVHAERLVHNLGRDCRDALLGLTKTCNKLRVAFWGYLGSRLRIPGHLVVPPLPGLVRCRGQPA
jgi:hypothetical protein